MSEAERKARCIGGPLHGQLIPANNNTYYVPYFPELPRYDASQEGGPTKLPDFFIYRIHLVSYGSGHSHYWAIPQGITLVGAMNWLWDAAKDQKVHSEEEAWRMRASLGAEQ